MFKRSVTAVLFGLLTVFSVQVATAQDEKKFEAGGQVSFIQVPTFTRTTTTGPLEQDRETNVGFGGRFGYNVSRYFGIEAEVNYFPRDEEELDGGNKTQGLFGAKVGRRFDKFGLFVKSRPGFMRFSAGDYVPEGGCIAIFPPPIACFRPVSTTNFAFDLGGIAEVYPSQNTILRFDVGDTMIRFGDRRVAVTNAVTPAAGPTVFPRGSETKHNLQVSAGFGIRF